ncbi:efflux RND transporter permease subunit [Oceanicoccus sagamiensis]|uniref:Cobalt-zinc-cadmium resistance protein n=1 Tax=Oceanicoccus sagamiensis TaxID=716816 RepID=A0A1X9N9L1_9GAMM|nr:efflux RND transporter permease subunit [Oceanicoccus sagamiensis]ARN74768.1 cobalt-zinc-cadmium resistance protein [Oceanicoccus sagamiensis]
MNTMIRWFIDNPVAANLLMWIFIIGGLLSFPSIYQEEYPIIDTDTISVNVAYLGATPLEMEESVCIRIEEAIEGVVGINKLRTRAQENNCRVDAELVASTDKARLMSDIKNRVDTISTFPRDIEKPAVSEMVFTSKVMQIAISGDTDERTLKRLGERVRDDLLGKPGISQITLNYVRPYELTLEVSELNLRRYGLTMQKIADAVRNSSIDLPAGSIRAASGEVMLRTKEQSYSREDFEQVVVLTRADGTQLSLKDIATIKDGFEESEMIARFNGMPAVIVDIQRVGNEDILAIADNVKAYVVAMDNWKPDGITATIWNDESNDLVERLDVLADNAISGMALVLISLAIFLNLRLAFWVAAGLAIAILGALTLFPTLNIAISTLSVISFIMVIGILVDDAIVVGERVFSYQRKGLSWRDAAVTGTQEVSIPVIFGVLTTTATFLPLMSIPGHLGPFFMVIGVVAILALVFSIIESQLILPAHLAHPFKQEEKSTGGWHSFQQKISDKLEDFVEQKFRPALIVALDNRRTTLAIACSVVLITLSMLISGWINVQFFPAIAGNTITVRLTMPEGTPLSKTTVVVAKLEAAAEQLATELDSDYPLAEGSHLRFSLSSIGGSTGAGSHGGISTSDANMAEIILELAPSEQRPVTTSIANRWRELTGPVPEAVELAFTATEVSAGAPVDIEFRGRDINELRLVAAELRQSLSAYPGVFDVSDSFRGGKQEIQLQLLPEAQTLGITAADLARQVRQAFFGEEVQRIQRGQDDIKVMLRYPEDQRRSISHLENMRIRSADGTEVPFARVATFQLGRGFSTINREDGQRLVRVTADVNRDIVMPEEVLSALREDVMPGLLANHPTVKFSLGGEAEQRSKAFYGLIKSFALSMVLVYTLLAIPLKSYLQPLIIMSVIPFGAIGAILGHFLIGQPLAFFSILGIVALSGVVVNASLVLVDYVNRQRRQGVALKVALVEAGCVRFRPVLLTSVTTFLGLLPIILSPSKEIGFFMPMAISLAFGVLFATAITLFLVPCIYLMFSPKQDYIAEEKNLSDNQHASA